MTEMRANGYHTILADSKVSATSIISTLDGRNNNQRDMINLVTDYMKTHDIDALNTNYVTVSRDTGVEQYYTRHLEDSNLDYAPNSDFSEKQIYTSQSIDVQVSAKIEDIEVKDIESELDDINQEIKKSQEYLNDLDEQITEQIEQQSPPRPIQQVPPPVHQEQEQEQNQNGSALGSIASSLAKYVANKTATTNLKDSFNKAMGTPSQPQNRSSITMQCQGIKDTINNLTNPSVCRTTEDAQKLSDSLNEQLVKLNQSMTQATKKVFNSTGVAKDKGAIKLKTDLESVSSTLDHMNNKTPELTSVIDKFDVKIDMAKVQESLKELTSQLKDALSSILKTDNSPSMSAG